MDVNLPNHAEKGATQPARQKPGSSRFLIGLLVLSCVAVSVAGWLLRRAPQTSHSASPAEPEGVVVTASVTPKRTGTPRAAAVGQRPQAAQPIFPPATPEMRALVDNLVNLQPTGNAMTDEQIAAWRKNLDQVIQQGPNAVPAIHEFLARNTDFDFGGNGRQTLGYSSARAAMLDALAQIGGPSAVAAMGDVLENTADPREIAVLAQSLSKLDPGVHEDQAVEAARQALAMAADGKLPDRDMAPLFEVLQKFGGANAVADLDRSADHWNYYSVIALGQLPDQAGIPTLIDMASSTDGSRTDARTAALKMLAQVAPQSEEARNALVEQVRQDKLSSFDWATLMQVLNGNHLIYQQPVLGDSPQINGNDLRSVNMVSSNQRYYLAPLGTLTIDQINQQQTFVEALLSVAKDPNAIQQLQKSRDFLAQKLQVASVSGPDSQGK